ncbi:MAG TPA: serine hydrolase [Candidatus Paceibacterota bacterium]|nr:serine hydrolase [Candidatus Paceibacterota bacterium]
MKTPYERSLIVLFGITAIIAAFFFHNYYKVEMEIERALAEEERIAMETWNKLDGLGYIAKAVSVYDATDNKKLYGKNDDVSMPIASLAKTMTVLTALLEDKDEEMPRVVRITPNAIYQYGDYGLFVNEKWDATDLAKFTMISSANDGAFALLGEKENPLEKMNQRATRMGMKNTTFLNFTGLDIPEEADSFLPAKSKPGAYSSAEDMNLLSVHAYRLYPEIFGATIVPEMNLVSASGFSHNVKNTNTSVEKIPGLLFSKTGNTNIAGGNLSIIFEDSRGHQIAVTVLGSTALGRFADIEKIVEALYK